MNKNGFINGLEYNIRGSELSKLPTCSVTLGLLKIKHIFMKMNNENTAKMPETTGSQACRPRNRPHDLFLVASNGRKALSLLNKKGRRTASLVIPLEQKIACLNYSFPCRYTLIILPVDTMSIRYIPIVFLISSSNFSINICQWEIRAVIFKSILLKLLGGKYANTFRYFLKRLRLFPHFFKKIFLPCFNSEKLNYLQRIIN